MTAATPSTSPQTAASTAGAPAPAAGRGGPFADLGLVARQIVAEQKTFWRNPGDAGFTFVFPIMFLVIFSSINGNGAVDIVGGKIGFATYYLPGIIGFSVLSACFTSVSMTMVNRRDSGILKRMRGTPLPTWAFMAGSLGSKVIVALLLTIVTTGVSLVAFDVPFPEHLPALIGVVLLGAACFSALGLAITAVIPNADAGPAIVNVITFPLLFLSGTFFPITNETLNRISDFLPVARLQHALFDSFAPPVRTGGTVVQASGPDGGDLLVLLVWFVVATALSVRFFRWESRNR